MISFIRTDEGVCVVSVGGTVVGETDHAEGAIELLRALLRPDMVDALVKLGAIAAPKEGP